MKETEIITSAHKVIIDYLLFIDLKSVHHSQLSETYIIISKKKRKFELRYKNQRWFNKLDTHQVLNTWKIRNEGTSCRIAYRSMRQLAYITTIKCSHRYCQFIVKRLISPQEINTWKVRNQGTSCRITPHVFLTEQSISNNKYLTMYLWLKLIKKGRKGNWIVAEAIHTQLVVSSLHITN